MAARMTYLDRYLAGEYEQVWAELCALGEAVREEPLYDDALAVARETMRRVRHDIELLVPRLCSFGFDFGYEWVLEDPQTHEKLTPEQAAGLRRWVLEEQKDYCTFRPPLPDALKRVIELEQRTGTLPLSLRAWYVMVGSVDLVGKPPASWAREVLGYSRPDEHARQELRNRFAAAAGSRGLTTVKYHHFMREQAALWHAVNDWNVYLDPLCVLPIEMALAMADNFMWQGTITAEDTFVIPVAPAYDHKWFQGSDDAYSIIVPCPAADTELVNEWHGTTFVGYLRTAFQWGGFPGLARAAHPPHADLATLTEGLLRF